MGGPCGEGLGEVLTSSWWLGLAPFTEILGTAQQHSEGVFDPCFLCTRLLQESVLD